MINALLNRRKIARISQTPGKTQAIHFYLINERFYLVDLPGYGFAKVPQSIRRTWGELVRSYIEGNDALRLIFLLLDVRRVPSSEDLTMHEWAARAGIAERILLTKSDKLSKNEMAKQMKTIAVEMEIEPEALIACSAVTKQGITEVRREIASCLG